MTHSIAEVCIVGESDVLATDAVTPRFCIVLWRIVFWVVDVGAVSSAESQLERRD
jgi:hypothetical protein